MSRSRKPSHERESGRLTPAWIEKVIGSEPALDAQTLPLPNFTSRQREAASSGAVEYSVSARTKFFHLGCWFALNLVLTLYNKSLLGGLRLPWLLTTLHTSCVSIGCYVLLLSGRFELSTLSTKDNMTLLAFSVLFTVNIAISNVSLSLVSLPFHQTLRTTIPLFTTALHLALYARTYSTSTYLSLLPLVLGVALATYGDYYFTPSGFLLTLLGVLLAALKTVATNRLLTGPLKLPALEALLRMSPAAAVQSFFMALLTGEVGRFGSLVRGGQVGPATWLVLAGNGCLAFVLNLASFATNRVAGALTLTVAGNVKTCVTVLAGIVMFDVRVGWVNGVGMVVTMVGAAWYSMVELGRKRGR